MAKDFRVASDFDWLLEQDFDVFSVRRQQGQWRLMVRQYLGVVRLPSGTLLEILPKIGKPEVPYQNDDIELQATRAWVQRMLRDISTQRQSPLKPKQLGQVSDKLAASLATSTAPPLSDWLLGEFISLLKDYLPLNIYEAQAQNSASLQGKLLIKQQLQRNAHQPHRFFSEVSQFAQNSLSNRFIKQAWQWVLAIVEGQDSTNLAPNGHNQVTRPNTSKSSSSNLWQSTVQIVPEQWRQIGTLSALEWLRLDYSYAQAAAEIKSASVGTQQKQIGTALLSLAYWLLKIGSDGRAASAGLHESHQKTINDASGQLQLSLFINMNHAFETWVETVLRQQFYLRDPRYQLHAQVPCSWLVDDNGQPCVTPVADLVVRYDHQPKLIIDVKWKTIRSSRDISASDAYQLAAYAQAYGVNKVWLVYPCDAPSGPLNGRSLNDSQSEFSKADHMDPSSLPTNQAVATYLTSPNKLRPSAQSGGLTGFEIWLIPFNVRVGAVLAFDTEKYFKIF